MYVDTIVIEDCNDEGVLHVLVTGMGTVTVGIPGEIDEREDLPILVREQDQQAAIAERLRGAQRSIPPEWSYSVSPKGFHIVLENRNIPVPRGGSALYCLALPPEMVLDDIDVTHPPTGQPLPFLAEVDPTETRQVVVLQADDIDGPRPFSMKISASGHTDPSMQGALRTDFEIYRRPSSNFPRLRDAAGNVGLGPVTNFLSRLLGGS